MATFAPQTPSPKRRPPDCLLEPSRIRADKHRRRRAWNEPVIAIRSGCSVAAKLNADRCRPLARIASDADNLASSTYSIQSVQQRGISNCSIHWNSTNSMGEKSLYAIDRCKLDTEKYHCVDQTVAIELIISGEQIEASSQSYDQNCYCSHKKKQTITNERSPLISVAVGLNKQPKYNSICCGVLQKEVKVHGVEKRKQERNSEGQTNFALDEPRVMTTLLRTNATHEYKFKHNKQAEEEQQQQQHQRLRQDRAMINYRSPSDDKNGARSKWSQRNQAASGSLGLSVPVECSPKRGNALLSMPLILAVIAVSSAYSPPIATDQVETGALSKFDLWRSLLKPMHKHYELEMINSSASFNTLSEDVDRLARRLAAWPDQRQAALFYMDQLARRARQRQRQESQLEPEQREAGSTWEFCRQVSWAELSADTSRLESEAELHSWPCGVDDESLDKKCLEKRVALDQLDDKTQQAADKRRLFVNKAKLADHLNTRLVATSIGAKLALDNANLISRLLLIQDASNNEGPPEFDSTVAGHTNEPSRTAGQSGFFETLFSVFKGNPEATIKSSPSIPTVAHKDKEELQLVDQDAGSRDYTDQLIKSSGGLDLLLDQLVAPKFLRYLLETKLHDKQLVANSDSEPINSIGLILFQDSLSGQKVAERSNRRPDQFNLSQRRISFASIALLDDTSDAKAPKPSIKFVELRKSIELIGAYKLGQKDWLNSLANQLKFQRLPSFLASWLLANQTLERDGSLDRLASKLSSGQLELNDGRWFSPYFDCTVNKRWLLAYSIPIFSKSFGSLGKGNNKFRGISFVQLDLAKSGSLVDQCVSLNEASSFFADTHQCRTRLAGSKCISLDQHFANGRGRLGIGEERKRERPTQWQNGASHQFQSGAYACQCPKSWPHLRAALSTQTTRQPNELIELDSNRQVNKSRSSIPTDTASFIGSQFNLAFENYHEINDDPNDHDHDHGDDDELARQLHRKAALILSAKLKQNHTPGKQLKHVNQTAIGSMQLEQFILGSQLESEAALEWISGRPFDIGQRASCQFCASNLSNAACKSAPSYLSHHYNSNQQQTTTQSLATWFRPLILVLQISCLLISLLLIGVILRIRKSRLIIVSGWLMLETMLFGALLLYTSILVRYFQPTSLTCLLEPWFRELGFSMFYGSILIKLYRILTEFQTRKAHRVCLRDKDQIVYLLAIVFIVIGYMSAWTALMVDGFFVSSGANEPTSTSTLLDYVRPFEHQVETWTVNRHDQQQLLVSPSDDSVQWPKGHDDSMPGFKRRHRRQRQDNFQLDGSVLNVDGTEQQTETKIERQRRYRLATDGRQKLAAALSLVAPSSDRNGESDSANPSDQHDDDDDDAAEHNQQAQTTSLNSASAATFDGANFQVVAAQQQRPLTMRAEQKDEKDSSIFLMAKRSIVDDNLEILSRGLNSFGELFLGLLESQQHYDFQSDTFVYLIRCRKLTWDYVTESSEIALLLFGLHLVYKLRNASLEVHKEKLILSVAIFVELLVSALLYSIRHSLWHQLTSDQLLVMYSIRCQLTVTSTVALVFGPKLWEIGKNKPSLLFGALFNYSFRRYQDHSSTSNCNSTSGQNAGTNSTGNTGKRGNSIRHRCHISCEVHDHHLGDASRLQQAILSNSALEIGSINLADMDPDEIQSELKRVYTQLEALKTKVMRRDNPHISKRRGGRKPGHRKFSLQAFHNRHNNSVSSTGGCTSQQQQQQQSTSTISNQVQVDNANISKVTVMDQLNQVEGLPLLGRQQALENNQHSNLAQAQITTMSTSAGATNPIGPNATGRLPALAELEGENLSHYNDPKSSKPKYLQQTMGNTLNAMGTVSTQSKHVRVDETILEYCDSRPESKQANKLNETNSNTRNYFKGPSFTSKLMGKGSSSSSKRKQQNTQPTSKWTPELPSTSSLGLDDEAMIAVMNDSQSSGEVTPQHRSSIVYGNSSSSYQVEENTSTN